MAVAGVDIYADEFDGIASVAGLELCGILERVGRHYTVIVVASGDHDGRVGGAIVLDGVQWRVVL